MPRIALIDIHVYSLSPLVNLPSRMNLIVILKPLNSSQSEPNLQDPRISKIWAIRHIAMTGLKGRPGILTSNMAEDLWTQNLDQQACHSREIS